MTLRALFAGGCVMLGVAGGFLLGADPATAPTTGPATSTAPALDMKSLKAEIVLAAAAAVPGQEVKATFRVTNVGQSAQAFQVMNCDWPSSWKTDQAAIAVTENLCGKNFAYTETLKPGETYERAGSLWVSDKAAAGVTKLRVSFQPIGEKALVWSEPVTLTIKLP